MLAEWFTAWGASWQAARRARTADSEDRPHHHGERREAPPLNRVGQVAEWREARRLPLAPVAIRRTRVEPQDALAERHAERARELRRAREARDPGPGVPWIGRRASAREPRGRQRRNPTAQ